MQVLKCCTAQSEAIPTIIVSDSCCLVGKCLPDSPPGRCAQRKNRLPVVSHVMTQVMAAGHTSVILHGIEGHRKSRACSLAEMTHQSRKGTHIAMTPPVTAKEASFDVSNACNQQALTDKDTAQKAFQAGIEAEPHVKCTTDAWPGQGVPGDTLLYVGSVDRHALACCAAGLKWHQNLHWIGG